jgi:methanethiol oxidase
MAANIRGAIGQDRSLVPIRRRSQPASSSNRRICPYAPHPHVERRYLIVPGLRSSRVHVIDTKPDPRRPKIVKVIEPDELHERTGYSRPHTVHCGPEGIYVGATGAPDGNGPGGVFVMDHDSFETLGRWEVERSPQYFAYDFWWHLGHDTMITGEWDTGWSRCDHAR